MGLLDDIYSTELGAIRDVPRTTRANYEKLKGLLGVDSTGNGLLSDLNYGARNALSQAKWNMGNRLDKIQQYATDPSVRFQPSTPESRDAIDESLMNLGSSVMPGAMAGMAKMVKGVRRGDTSMDLPPEMRSASVDRQGNDYTVNFNDRRHPINGSKLLESQSVSFTHEPTIDVPERRIISPEDLYGGSLIPASGDRSAAGVRLTRVGNTEIPGVELQGGPGYMLTHANKGTIWAAGKSDATKLANQAKRAAEDGNPVYMPYVSMGLDSIDFSAMPTQTILQMLQNGKITKKTAKEFDRELRSVRPEWPGLMSDEASVALSGPGVLRDAFVKLGALDKYRNFGFPDIGTVRTAATNPDLLNARIGDTGYVVGKVDPAAGVIQSHDIQHDTYPSHIAGNVFGGMDSFLPRKDVWHDFFANRRAQGKPESGDDIAFRRVWPIQKANQEWLDRVMPIWEKRQAGLLED